ncbi:MAG: hypothetical protein MUW56_21865 [Chryseobacterium sp.]|uniref:hypothetical protein n=1 Tax=Chryseobacterium sp. TaxID=1871047 RepID=UPI0025BEAABC|nr:hypothetical protein [Chryseobacterium sp.]MCJ7936202.1 hypothetical protein [Chryseobacterium sp.]
MKFEEVPVSYYTGIPDINIPLVNIPTNNSNVKLNVQLKYHSLNAKPDDKAGEAGLGWSLIAGGTISRTVRGGGPDEKNRTIAFSTSPKVKYGIYNHFYNPTYKILNNDNSFNFNDYRFDAGIGKFDTEYDLYQYNFMDKSGRFYVVKNLDGTYTAEKLDKNNLKITCSKDAATGVINSFTIIDDKGIKYIFNAMETSQKGISTIKTGLTTGQEEFNPSLELGDYYTSFHLVKINDHSNVNLAEFKYDLASEVKYQETPTTTRRIAKNVNYNNNTDQTGGQQINPDGSMPGAFERQIIYTTSQTRLLTSIDVRGRGTIYFNYEQGRQDSNYTEPANLYKLKSIQTNYWGQSASQYTDKYIFDYDYTNTNFQPYNGPQLLKKMVLKKVTKISPSTQNSDYLLEYNGNSSLLKKDDWGYYKASDLSLNNDIVTDVIKSITYPTKGKVVFNFDENEYSYHPTSTDLMVPVAGYNVTNSFDSDISFLQFGPTKQQFFTIQSAQTVSLDLFLGNLIYFNWQFKLYKKNTDGTFSPAVYEFGYAAQTCNKVQPPACLVVNPNPDGQVISEFNKTVYLEPGVYYASLAGDFGPSNPDQTGDTFIAHTTETTYVNAKVQKGGGIRIKDISYLENPASGMVSKKYVYNYTNLDDTQRSSGALVFPEPIFRLTNPYSYQNKYNNFTISYSAEFDITTDYNILPVQKTQSSDVGYKYISVEQIDTNNNKKGKTVYNFRSPIDYPNDATVIVQLTPIPIPNQDYLRGQLISDKKYDTGNNLLSEVTTDYTTSVYQKNDGVKLKDNYANNMISELFSFSSYQEMVNKIGIGFALTDPYKNFESFGVTLPTQRIEKSYFYKNGVQSVISSTTDNVYNSNDYPTAITQNFQDGSINITNYKYATEKANQRLIDANMIGIPLETEVKNNNKIVSKEETLYDDPSHLFPSSVLSYDLQHIPSTDITYDKYDDKGNLLQYTTKEGIPVTIIWGYNQTLPIARVKGATYDQLSGLGLIPGLVSASDADAANPANEPVLIATLDQFRNNSSLSAYQISTFTYDPLIGVTSITPPSGIREVYQYDSANRLEKVVDVNGKVLKELKYHYKN